MQEAGFLFYRDGQKIFEENSQADEIYIIKRGQVELSKRVDGNELSMGVLEEGEMFGEIGTLTDSLRHIQARAIGNVYLRPMKLDQMLERMQSQIQEMVLGTETQCMATLGVNFVGSSENGILILA